VFFHNYDDKGCLLTDAVGLVLLAGARADVRYGGNCTPEEHDRLLDKQKNACGNGGSQNLPECKGHLSADENLPRQMKMASCRNARNNINNQCFAGGNQGHRDQVDQILTQMAKCDRFINRLPRP
jgi:hypothetical protein